MVRQTKNNTNKDSYQFLPILTKRQFLRIQDYFSSMSLIKRLTYRRLKRGGGGRGHGPGLPCGRAQRCAAIPRAHRSLGLSSLPLCGRLRRRRHSANPRCWITIAHLLHFTSMLRHDSPTTSLSCPQTFQPYPEIINF